MKKLTFFLLILTPLLIQACQGTGNSENKNQKASIVAGEDASKAVTHLTAEEFREKVVDYKNSEKWDYQGDKPCLIDFYADWCGPCKTTSPIIADIAKEYQGKIHVYKVDVDKERELASVMGIQSIPAFLYCPVEGKPRMSSGIGQSKADTKQMFKDNIEQFLLNN
ncbi:MAG: thioredoxin domain-containing protein [Bacteroidales bacterium]|nr:redoxin domain-containing protein [Bacteroidales bacterium]